VVVVGSAFIPGPTVEGPPGLRPLPTRYGWDGPRVEPTDKGILVGEAIVVYGADAPAPTGAADGVWAI
jgi:hypothetical protein